MISDKQFKRLCEIDVKMLDNKPVTNEEIEERKQILKDFNCEIDKGYLDNGKLI